MYHPEYVRHQEGHTFLASHRDLADHSLEVVSYPFQLVPSPPPWLPAAVLVDSHHDLS